MQSPSPLLDLERRLEAVQEHALDAKARDAWLARLDMLLPAESVSTAKYAENMLIPGPNRQGMKLNLKITPYIIGIMDAMDMPGVRIVGVKGGRRMGKTIAAESKLFKTFHHGPVMNMLWFMQSKDDLNAWVDERFEWMWQNNEAVAAKVDRTRSRNARTNLDVGGALFQAFPATQRSMRGKSALLIVADEIDAMDKRVRGGIVTLVLSSQNELGGAAIAYLASHPDAGPVEGIDAVIADGTIHLWWVRCEGCGEPSSFAKEADEIGARMFWNVPGLLGRQDEMERSALLDLIGREVRLVCPHCGSMHDDAARKRMSSAGAWLQPHQKMDRDGIVHGEARIDRTMGFVIHGFMSPFLELPTLARDWANAKITADNTGSDRGLREFEVKQLGQTYEGSKAAEQKDTVKVLQQRLGSSFFLKTVPDRVLFLTAFVDVQGDRFEVVVIGWNLAMESWLIDRYQLRQWEGFQNISPGVRLSDWRIIEEGVLSQTYPLVSRPEMRMPIARVMVNSAGVPGVTNNARLWWANMMARGSTEAGIPMETWRVTLFFGNSNIKSELYGRAKQILHDERGKLLKAPAVERALNVHDLKLMIASRMKVEEGPGRIHMPADLAERYYREMVSEKFYNGRWVEGGANETWDGFVACEAARYLMHPERSEIDWRNDPPPWATPIAPGQALGGVEKPSAKSFYDRLAKLNEGLN